MCDSKMRIFFKSSQFIITNMYESRQRPHTHEKKKMKQTKIKMWLTYLKEKKLFFFYKQADSLNLKRKKNKPTQSIKHKHTVRHLAKGIAQNKHLIPTLEHVGAELIVWVHIHVKPHSRWVKQELLNTSLCFRVKFCPTVKALMTFQQQNDPRLFSRLKTD